MQSKGAIKFFAIVLALVCLYQLSFTFITGRIEKKAERYAGNDTTRMHAYLDSMSNEKVYPVFGFTYKECKDREINLGLDLKGGMNVTMEVSMVDLIRALSGYNTDPTFNKAIAEAQAKSVNSQKDFVDLFYESITRMDPNIKLAAIFANRDLQGKVELNSTNDQVLKVIKAEAQDAFDRTYNIIKKRIDKFGVAQPNVQKLPNNRILVELPGIKEPERVRKILQGTAKLEFWTTYDNQEILPKLKDVNEYLKRVQSGDSLFAQDTTKKDTSHLAVKDDAVKAANDTGKKDVFAKLAGSKDTGKATLGGDTMAAKRDKFIKENPLFSILLQSEYQDQRGNIIAGKGPLIGRVQIKDTAKVDRILAMDGVKARLPNNFKALWSAQPEKENPTWLELIAIKMPRDERAPLEGDVITDARKQKSQFTDNWEVSMSMNEQGAGIWRRLTRENVGHSIAVVLDDYVYSYPNVQGEIAGGNSQITGRFTLEQSEDLATVLSVGKLPAPARIVEDTVVGPTLGQEAISKGLRSFIIALIVVLIFMVAYYNNAGLIADVALFCNVFFVMGVLASLGAVLTLPGIAGIVLTIGMSVDANILIFERVREEMSLGKGLRLAISDGFKHAYSSIIDSNLTTLILGIILYVFGTGPIQGFATTLIIGILSSLFCAIFITRIIFEWQLGRNKEIKFWNNTTKGAFKNIHINFVGRRKIYYILSSIIIIAGIATVATKGLNFGVDFQGGRTFVVRFDKPVETDAVIDVLKGPLERAPEVKTYGTSGNQLRITTNYKINETGSTVEEQVDQKLKDGLSHLPNNSFKIMSRQQVGPTIANDIKSGALGAILFGCLLMFIFIFIRFKRWTYGLGAVVALFHDVLVVLSLYTIFNGILPFSLEIDQAFVAAVLTVMGYSMTDTVVVFDRIREFVGVHHHAQDQKKVINDALNATLSRTINTSLTIFFVLLAIFIFGSEVIRGFTFALLIGIVIGTYSSICIATPIVVDLAGKDTSKLE